MKTTSQKNTRGLPDITAQSSSTAPVRKHDHEITAARESAAWLQFEAGIYQNEQLRARVARSLDRYALGSSSLMVDDALDFLIHKDLGAAAQYFNRTGSAGFNSLQVSNAVYTFMTRKHQQVFRTALPIREDEADHDYEVSGSIPASHIHDDTTTSPDEHAARSDALRTISVMVQDKNPELYDLLLALGESGTRARVEAYASRHQLAVSSVYQRIKKLATTIQSHPLFAELAAPFTTSHQPA